jgi:hypothetical protein
MDWVTFIISAVIGLVRLLCFWHQTCILPIFNHLNNVFLSGHSNRFSWNAKGWHMGCHSYLIWSDWILCEDLLHVGVFLLIRKFFLLIWHSWISVMYVWRSWRKGTFYQLSQFPGTILIYNEFLSFKTDSKQIWSHTKIWLQSQCMINNLIVGKEHFFTCVMMWSSKKYATLTKSLINLICLACATKIA